MPPPRNVGIFDSILETIGWTPLVRLTRVAQGIRTQVLAKCEFFNPCSSLKDRIGIAMVEEAERRGLLKPGGTIVEATSGNTGAALAMIAAQRGYRAIFTMPDKMSQEKIRLLKAFGAEVIITPTAVPPDSPDNYRNVARRLAEEIPNSFLPNQHFNPVNPEAHYRTTGQEIWEQTGGAVDAFVAGMGTGGTMTGVARYLKERKPEVRIVGADPVGSAIKEYFETGRIEGHKVYKVEGIGEDIIPGALQLQYVDEIRSVTDKESFLMTRRLTREEGIFAGGSSGTIVHVALQVAREWDDPGKTVVCILADTGERYLSKCHSDEWMRENRFLEPERLVAGELLTAKPGRMPALISISSHTVVREALALMEEKNISQLPVLDEGASVGSVSEGALMSRVLGEPGLLETSITGVLEPPFPEVDYREPLSKVSRLLTRENPAVLVREAGRIVGILTKYDIVHFLTTL